MVTIISILGILWEHLAPVPGTITGCPLPYHVCWDQYVAARYCACLLILWIDFRSFDDQTSSVGKEVKGRNHMYYQVLIDSRDCPHIVSRIFRAFNRFGIMYL